MLPHVKKNKLYRQLSRFMRNTVTLDIKPLDIKLPKASDTNSPNSKSNSVFIHHGIKNNKSNCK